MAECENEACPNRFFHLRCVGLTYDSLPETWFCSAACRQQGDERTNCVCKKKRTDIPMVECCNILCQMGIWFHMDCVKLQSLPTEAELWFCCCSCKTTGVVRSQTRDMSYRHSKALLFQILGDMIRHDAVKENDGPGMLMYWKCDLLWLYANHHPKYVILGHRLIAGQYMLRYDGINCYI
ncbi:hypothetical protein DPMN_150952 [Dreissena polymorpha]|uniref:PHD-type domain-containing protein n=1 Tax=Dreissena polymorpha TaxID=45954 RepID=A0A9D4FK89_DREPO|nr:hypothetical protein DPMN_150952 [Dreissena polymorpha]